MPPDTALGNVLGRDVGDAAVQGHRLLMRRTMRTNTDPFSMAPNAASTAHPARSPVLAAGPAMQPTGAVNTRAGSPAAEEGRASEAIWETANLRAVRSALPPAAHLGERRQLAWVPERAAFPGALTQDSHLFRRPGQGRGRRGRQGAAPDVQAEAMDPVAPTGSLSSTWTHVVD
jgi:hypothetical protein